MLRVEAADPRNFKPSEAPGPSAGEDVDGAGNGTLLEGRLYQLVRIHDAVRERTFQITFCVADQVSGYAAPVARP